MDDFSAYASISCSPPKPPPPSFFSVPQAAISHRRQPRQAPPACSH
ncbi:hypothetical protein [Actinoplanes sp. DH11]|nr:hypothetical protein [Actinoplanes sp. DH11]